MIMFPFSLLTIKFIIVAVFLNHTIDYPTMPVGIAFFLI